MDERSHPPRPSSPTGRGAPGERRIITVMFCDVVGSTALAEQLDAEEWTEIMNEAFDYLIQPVHRYEGTVARLMGDGILALFGAPVAHEDDPQRAVLAGLGILDGIHEFSQNLHTEYGIDFELRVGINTGPVVVGEVGSSQAGEYTAMGDAVNLAARMEQTASPGTLQISEDTWHLVAPLFDLESLGQIDLKGKSEPVQTYRVLRPKAAPGRVRGIEGLNSPLIGRESEHETLSGILAHVREGRGGIVSLIGEAGLGKSRLLDELRSEWGEDSTWVVSRGVSYDTTRPYALFQQRVLQLFGVESRDSPSVIRQKIAHTPEGFSPEVHDTLAGAVEALLAIGEDHDSPQLQGEALKNRIYQACHEMWRAVASATPTVMVMDDLHWSDEASVELLIDLLPLVEELPLGILCAFRPERQSPAWRFRQHTEVEYPHLYTEVNLSRLSDDDSNDLVNNLLAVADLPDVTRGLILQKTEGNPYFVEEVTRSLIEGGSVVRDRESDTWRVEKDIGDIVIPDNLQGLIISRMDRLDDDARRAMQLASVVGRNFHFSVLNAIWNSDAPLERQLSTLQRAGLIVETARLPEREYAFKHELTRDAAYASMLRRRCRQFHRLVGGAIETLFADRIEDQAHRLAYHFAEAMDNDRTLKYSSIAGDQSLRMYANNDAAVHYARAIATAKTLGAPAEQFIYLYTRKVAALQEAGRFEELVDNCKELEALGVEMGEPAMELEAIIPLAVVYSTFTRVRDQPLGEETSKRALELARELKDHRAEAKSLWLLMLLNYFGGSDIARAVEYGEQSLAIARDNRLQEETAYALNDLARAYQQLGRPDIALKYLGEARDMWRQMDNKPMLIDSLVGFAMTYYESGSSTLALESSEEALRLCDEIGNLWGRSAALGGTLIPLLDQGEPGKAIAAAEEAVHLANESGFVGAIAAFWSILAWSYTVVGLVDAGLEAIRQATADSDERSEFREIVQLVHAYVLLLSADRERAEESIKAAIGDLETNALDPALGVKMGAFRFFPSIVIGEVLWETERFERLIEFSDLAIESMENRQVRRYVDDMLRLKGRAQYQLGRYQEARATLTRGCDLAQQYESKRNLWPMLDLLGRVEQALGNEAHGAELRGQARRIVREIAEAAGRPEIREGFLGLPQVRELMLGA